MNNYPHRTSFATRWNDNDVYGHLNNTIYYAAMDTAINTWMIAIGGLDIAEGDAIALCVSSSCEYTASGAFPDELTIGLRAGRVGTSSIRWELGIFRADELLAAGTFVHVFVSRGTRRPVPIPAVMRAAIERDLIA